MILVTGAAGKTGQAVVQQLISQGQDVRGLVRRREQAEVLKKLGIREAVIGDMVDPAAMEKAAANIKAIYHICPNMHPEETLIGEIAIRAALAASIERFVYHSVLHPQIEAMAHHWQKLRVEEKLFESGLDFTILQPAAYMQNVFANWDRIVVEGVYAVPYAVETRLSTVDLHEVAEVAAKVLVEKGHEGAVYELSGPQALSQDEIANVLVAQLGRPVRAEVISIADWEQQARSAGLGDYAVKTLVRMFQYYEQYGFWGNPKVLGWLLGRPPLNFAHFLERTMQEWEQA